ncbi:oligoribonuclease [Natronoglycomyces albus]|uniref:Oligoribonuclease n=2 Tax=Natronoglycomyces albus TaxID=2811108 RepID=A0A895XN91_9ACTN|nr:oligoribonuclease [Natronoglycomyces albus]QSB04515.1 oligoribonuclease [Natronoglycomyces albus]
MNERLVWVDCEMTGLNLQEDALIEVAALVTEPDLTPLDDGIDIVISAEDAKLDSMAKIVADMHAKSGLTDEVRAATTTMSEAEDQILEYVAKHIPDPRTAPLCGNSIATDRTFLARDMPRFNDYLHYRMIDVSSLKELCRRWYPRVYFHQPEKGLRHRALSDILDSIRELEYYRKAVLVPLPGPDSEEAKAIAASLAPETALVEEN